VKHELMNCLATNPNPNPNPNLSSLHDVVSSRHTTTFHSFLQVNALGVHAGVPYYRALGLDYNNVKAVSLCCIHLLSHDCKA